MRKFLLILSMLFLSCSNDDACDKQLDEAYKNYETALNNCNGSLTAMYEVKRQFEIKKQSILNNCK